MANENFIRDQKVDSHLKNMKITSIGKDLVSSIIFIEQDIGIYSSK